MASVCRGPTNKLPAADPVTTCPVPAAACALSTADNPPAMVQQILSLSEKRNIPVSGFTVAVGFETTPQRMDQMQVRWHTAALIFGHCKVAVQIGVRMGAWPCWLELPAGARRRCLGASAHSCVLRFLPFFCFPHCTHRA